MSLPALCAVTGYVVRCIEPAPLACLAPALRATGFQRLALRHPGACPSRLCPSGDRPQAAAQAAQRRERVRIEAKRTLDGRASKHPSGWWQGELFPLPPATRRGIEKAFLHLPGALRPAVIFRAREKFRAAALPPRRAIHSNAGLLKAHSAYRPAFPLKGRFAAILTRSVLAPLGLCSACGFRWLP